MPKSNVPTLKCRVLRKPHGMIGAGKRPDNEERRFILIEIIGDLPAKNDYEYGDDVVVKRISTQGRKR